MWNPKSVTNELIHKIETDLLTYKTNSPKGKGGGGIS